VYVCLLLLSRHEKILKCETQLQSGKALDEEQLILMTSKPSVEKSLLDLKALQVSLEEVAKEEKDRENGGCTSPVKSTSYSNEPADECKDSGVSEPVVSSTGASATVSTGVAATAAAAAATVASETDDAVLSAVRKLLELIHVYNL
jgi:hypothetical protein